VTIGSTMTVRSGTREGGEEKGLGFFVLLGSHDSGTLASRQVQISRAMLATCRGWPKHTHGTRPCHAWTGRKHGQYM